MKKMRFLNLLALLSIFITSDVFSQSAKTVKGEAIIRLHNGSDINAFSQRSKDAFGVNGDFGISRCLIPDMNIWLVHYNDDLYGVNEALYLLRMDSATSIAQANHIIEERLLPDDPLFELQWHHEQASDHDIDTPQAWDITTGGTNALGHDVVVCVVEINGTQWNTPDIIDNHWVNINEIPDNGVDDDENGYVDDYDGWNANSNNDNIGTGDHGTRVSSMIGSKGNNTLGVTGVNWDVKLMQVQISGSNEAAAIEGYAYPLAMRRLYNQTGGAEGAFVVATNSSWGTDGGQAVDAPLWCAMYDSLGSEGVLSCGSTTNNNVDVDDVGDLPTGCPSDYLISVARTNSEDIRAGGGYGITTIDLAAPGDAVYLANNSSYGNTTGTSFSSPCVAGAIALIYSAPCTSLAEQSITAPAFAALQMKEVILSGVDTTTQLQSELLSGGRLNVWNSLQQVMAQCDNSLCSAPFGVVVNQVIGNNYDISWNASSSALSFELRYRVQGNVNWTSVTVSTSSTSLNNLSTCAVYELQVKSICDGDTSDWSNMVDFLTDGCCENPDDVVVISNSGNAVTLTWSPVLAATGYTVSVMDMGGMEVVSTTVAENDVTIEGLQNCSNYFVYVYSICAGFPPPPVGFSIFSAGCDNCSQLEVCSASSTSTEEFIQLVSLESINRVSESDEGYVFVTDQTTDLIRGESYTIILAPGFTSSLYNENFRVWIDLDSDGNFDDSEDLVFDAPQPTQAEITGTIFIPESAALGSVRMRVGMAYTPSSSVQEPLACGVWNFGEVEDYCVNIISSVSAAIIQDSDDMLFPVPANDKLYVQGLSSIQRCYDSIGREFVLPVSMSNGLAELNVSNLCPGVYVLLYESGGVMKSSSFIVNR